MFFMGLGEDSLGIGASKATPARDVFYARVEAPGSLVRVTHTPGVDESPMNEQLP